MEQGRIRKACTGERLLAILARLGYDERGKFLPLLEGPSAVSHKALSIKQPWAALLAHGPKTIEIRRWRTGPRETLLIHAARIPDDRPEAWAQVPPELREAAQQVGGIIGVGRLDSYKVYHNREAFVADQGRHLNDPAWFEPGLVGLCFTQLRVVPFREAPGYMRIFKVELDDLEIPPPPALAATLPGPCLSLTEEEARPPRRRSGTVPRQPLAQSNCCTGHARIPVHRDRRHQGVITVP